MNYYSCDTETVYSRLEGCQSHSQLLGNRFNSDIESNYLSSTQRGEWGTGGTPFMHAQCVDCFINIFFCS